MIYLNKYRRCNINYKSIYLILGLLFISTLIGIECVVVLENSSNIVNFVIIFFLSMAIYIISGNKHSLMIPVRCMFLINALREPIFVDDYRYTRIFESINSSASNIFLLQNEKGFLILNYAISLFTDDYSVAQIILLGISFYFLYKGILGLQDVMHPFFILTYYFFVLLYRFSAAGLVRMQMAVSLYIYSIIFLESNHVRKFIIWILIASLFHRSALAALVLLIPFYFNKYLKDSPFNWVVLTLFLVALTTCINPIVSLISNLLGGKYEGYVNIINFHVSSLSIFYILSFIILFFCKGFLAKNNQSFYNTCIFMFLFAIIIDLFFTGKTAFGRINYYFLLSYAFLTGIIWKNCENNFLKISVLFIFMFFIIVYFWGGQLGDSYILMFFENYKNMLLK